MRNVSKEQSSPRCENLAPATSKISALSGASTGSSKKKKAVYGFVTVRYQWEIAGRTSTEGAVWNILATFPLKPIHLP